MKSRINRIIAGAAHALEPVAYLDWDDATKTNATCTVYEIVTPETAAFEDGKWYVVTNGADIMRGTIRVNGSAHLILCDGGRLGVGAYGSDPAGVEVTDGRAFTVYGQQAGTGELFARGGSYTGSGIGGSGLTSGDGHDCGKVTVNGGMVTADGGQCGAGIGGAYRGAGGTVTINGGTVTATGGQLAPGIGAGYEGTSDGTLALAPGLGGVYLPEATPDSVGSAPVGDRTETIGGRSFRSRLHADLYQLGIGPRVTWHALSWLDVYAGADILLNIDSTRFEADGSACSRTDSLVGFGGNVGVVGRLTDWVGVYGQVGYEWVDRNRLSAGGFSAEIDYSSLVLSAGVQFRF